MGLARRNKSGNILGGSKLIVPGQGIFTVKNTPNDKVSIKSQNLRSHSRPTPTPSSSQIPTPTPTPTPTSSMVCYLSTEFLDNLMTENNDFLIVNCP
jgi:hypothetical protein